MSRVLVSLPEGLHVVDTIAALDVVLSLARTCDYPHPDRDSSLLAVQKLRTMLRETIR
jgi:hypothetical protein